MADLFFTTGHEWVRLDGLEAVVGITGDGLNGDVVYIELPDIGRRVETGEACAQVETAKQVRDVCAPMGGVVVAVNDSVFDDPDVIARQPMDTWLFKLRTDGGDTRYLMAQPQYEAWLRRQKGGTP